MLNNANSVVPPHFSTIGHVAFVDQYTAKASTRRGDTNSAGQQAIACVLTRSISGLNKPPHKAPLKPKAPNQRLCVPADWRYGNRRAAHVWKMYLAALKRGRKQVAAPLHRHAHAGLWISPLVQQKPKQCVYYEVLNNFKFGVFT